MNKHKAYTALMIMAIAVLFAVNANAQPSPGSGGGFENAVNDFQVRQICQHSYAVQGEADEVLGTFFPGDVWNFEVDGMPVTGTDNEIVFLLSGMTGYNYKVKGSITNNGSLTTNEVNLDYDWYTSTNGTTWSYVCTDAMDGLFPVSGGSITSCNSKRWFKIHVVEIAVGSNVAPNAYIFNVTTTADIDI
jgi:hypothetical protein